MEYLTHSLIDQAEALQIIQKLKADKSSWQDGKKTAGSQAAQIKSNFQFDKNSKLSTSVLNFAGKVNPDLIIIMTQSENHFLSHFIGSTAQSIINSSDNPVLSITPAKRKDTTMYDLPLG